ncbi:camk camkl kin1 protein kinase [Lichtheimia corymbifera JMRC:FSU:9682]|uniref:non-specific serine/threonine protein kinase n=1 Tax=Lichtheimia corymbifera JMRC:FSU:9682 TaxID=1263082 RepID=A0A068RGR9_9FUNG|nr:camk camkl kin1 protein kinase [Lichtheimia corymbifera JMRC:FSU:9682]
MFAADHQHTLNDDHAVSDQQVETITDIEPSYEERVSPSSSYHRSKSISPVASSHASSAAAPPQQPTTTKTINTTPSRTTSMKQRPKPRKVIGNYTLVSTLGSGSMGKVKLAMHNITQEKLAVKIVPRTFANEKSSSSAKDKDENREIRTIREASIMLLLYHPYIVSLKEMVVLDPYYYLFMEYVGGGQLLDYIISHGRLKEKHARRFARQIVSALDYCHRNSIVHRDLKIENILISQSGHVKIIDFGLSNLFSPRDHLSTFCGSLYFAAPELLNAKAYTGPEVDVWSFGIVLYVLVCGKVPFDDQSMPALHAKIKRGHVEYPSHLSSECKNLLSRMLVTNPNHRGTISEISVHPWMNRGYDGPVDNHLPDRAPLMLPVDMEVIRNMTGFGFGTEAEIKQQLENIITSDEYQKAAKTLAKRTRDHHHQHQQHHYLTSRLTTHSPIPTSKKSYAMPNDDPQSIPAAYHPLVSIYYLVKERMERERRAATSSDPDNPRISVSSTGSYDNDAAAAAVSSSSPTGAFRVPDIPMPETAAHPVDTPIEHTLFATHKDSIYSGRGTTTAGVAFGRRGRTNIRVDEEGHIIQADRPNLLESGLQRIRSRRSKASDSSLIDDDSSSEHGNVFRRLSHALHRSSTERKRERTSAELNAAIAPIMIPSTSDKGKATTTHHHQSNEHQQHGSSFGDKVSHLLGRAGSANAHANSAKRPHPQRRPRQATVTGANPLMANEASRTIASGKAPAQALPPEIGHQQQQQQPNTAIETRKSDDVSNRDNEPSPHNHEQAFPVSAHGDSTSASRGTADETVKQVFLKGLFSVTTTSTKHPSVIRADLIRVLERIGVKWRESRGRFECVHMPSIDMKRVKKDDDKVPEDSPTSGSGAGGAATSHVTVPDLIVRFEIYIVKVSWLLGMHGLQFRRVSGDPFLYKNICSRILAELKL